MHITRSGSLPSGKGPADWFTGGVLGTRMSWALCLGTVVLVAWSHVSAAESERPNMVPGQMWSVRSDPQTPAKVVIGRIEPLGDKEVVHVSLIDVPVPADITGVGESLTVGHMPFERRALEESLDSLLSTGVSPAPNFEAGYEQWSAAKGGAYTIPVSEAIAALFDTIRKGR